MVDIPYVCRYATLDELRRLRTRGAARYWLARGEAETYERLRDGARRESWLTGRILAKRLIAEYAATRRLEVPAVGYRQVEIDSGQVAGRRSRPEVWIAGRAYPWSLSISHTQRSVLVALSSSAETRVGVDLVETARYGEGFADLWFTAAERRWLEACGDPRWPPLFWAAKEAVYKAVNQGEPFYPRRIEILPDTNRQLYCTHQGRRITFRTAQTRQGEIAVVAATRRVEQDP